MSINPLNDISRVYLEQIVLSEAKIDKKLPEHERSGARLRRYDNPSGALALGGGQQRARRAEHEARRGKPKRWWDDDGDGIGYEKGEVSGKFVRKEAKETPKRWWDDDGDGIGYEPGEVSGKFKRKKEKKLKESFSNWRGDLFEILDTMDSEESQSQIKEKKVKNKITINPNIGEAVEELGGTLLEMIEVDELDFIVESVYDELIDEGYYESDIEEALEYALVEARVTYGHDTPTMEKKREGLLSIVKRKLSGAKKALKRNIKKGAEYVARKMSDDDETKRFVSYETKPSAAHSKPGVRAAQPYRDAGAGRVEKAGSPKPKRMEKISDPWEGSETTSTKKTTKPKAKPKPKAKTTKVSSGSAKSSPKRRSKLDDLLADIRSEEVQINEKTLTASETQEKERIVKSMKSKAADFEKRYPGRGKEVMYATATKMAKKIAEQQLDEISSLDEARAEEKRGYGSTGSERQRMKSGESGPRGRRPVTSFSGGQNPHRRGKKGRTPEQRRASSRRYVDQPGGVYGGAENEQGRGRYASMQAKKRDQSHMRSRFD